MYLNESPESKNFYICNALNEKQNAQMVKSVDTLVSGTSARKGVQVRVLFWALSPALNAGSSGRGNDRGNDKKNGVRNWAPFFLLFVTIPRLSPPKNG